MPLSVGDIRPVEVAVNEDLGYKYPLGLDLRPDRNVHRRLIANVMARAQEGHEVIQRRHNKFTAIEKNLCSYIAETPQDVALRQDDESMPPVMVIPIQYAVLETLLTYWMNAFAADTIFKFRGVGPEDRINAMLAELLIDYQVTKNKILLPLHTQWRDSLAYGIGISTPSWEVRTGRVTKPVKRSAISEILGTVIDLPMKYEAVTEVQYEGVALNNVSIFNFIPDPNTPIQNAATAEFVSWTEITNMAALLELERQNPELYFNVKYLKGRDNTSRYVHQSERPGSTVVGSEFSRMYSTPVHLLHMYVNLIPRDWRVGRSEYPERWLFTLAGDSILIRAQPMNLNMNKFPISVCAPTYDGYSVSPTSILELVQGAQDHITWQFNTHFHNVHKSLHDMLIVDPWLVNYNTVANRKPGKLITIREQAWGRGVQNAVEQLKVTDVTQNYITDVSVLIDMTQRITGAVDSLQGIMRQSSERRSATESRDTRTSALSRVQKQARIAGVMCMSDLGEMFLSLNQQFLEHDKQVQVAGRNAQILQGIYGTEYVKIGSLDLLGAIDVIAADGSSPGGEFLEEQMRLFQLAMSTPETALQFDSVRIMLQMYAATGVKDPSALLKQPARLAIFDSVNMANFLNAAEDGVLQATPVASAGQFNIEKDNRSVTGQPARSNEPSRANGVR